MEEKKIGNLMKCFAKIETCRIIAVAILVCGHDMNGQNRENGFTL